MICNSGQHGLISFLVDLISFEDTSVINCAFVSSVIFLNLLLISFSVVFYYARKNFQFKMKTFLTKLVL